MSTTEAFTALWSSHPNQQRNTVDGPPALIWEQCARGYGLYVNGERVGEPVPHHTLVEMCSHDVVRLVNELLTASWENR